MLTTQSGSRIWASASDDGGRRAEDDHLGGHQTAGGALLVLEEAADDVGVVGVHHAEHSLLIGRGHLAEEVGQVVVLHLVEHADEAVEVEFGDDADLLLFGQFLQHVGEAFVIHRLGQLATLVDRQGAHDSGHLCRVEVAESSGFGLHLARCVEQGGDLVVVDEAVARSAAQRALARQAHPVDHPVRRTTALVLTQGDVAHRSRRRSSGRSGRRR